MKERYEIEFTFKDLLTIGSGLSARRNIILELKKQHGSIGSLIDELDEIAQLEEKIRKVFKNEQR